MYYIRFNDNDNNNNTIYAYFKSNFLAECEYGFLCLLCYKCVLDIPFG